MRGRMRGLRLDCILITIRMGAVISKTINNSFKKIYVLLMKCNANLLLNRCPMIRDIQAQIEPLDSNENVN